MPMRLTVGTHYAGQTSWWLNGHNNTVVAWGRTDVRFGDRRHAGRQRLQNMVRHRRIRSRHVLDRGKRGEHCGRAFSTPST